MDERGIRNSEGCPGLDLDVCRDRDLIDMSEVDVGQMGTSYLGGTMLGPDSMASVASSGTGYEGGRSSSGDGGGLSPPGPMLLPTAKWITERDNTVPKVRDSGYGSAPWTGQKTLSPMDAFPLSGVVDQYRSPGCDPWEDALMEERQRNMEKSMESRRSWRDSTLEPRRVDVFPQETPDGHEGHLSQSVSGKRDVKDCFGELRIGRKVQVQSQVPGRSFRHDTHEPRRASECLQPASADGDRLDHGIRTGDRDRQGDSRMDPRKSWMDNTPEPRRADAGLQLPSGGSVRWSDCERKYAERELDRSRIGNERNEARRDPPRSWIENTPMPRKAEAGFQLPSGGSVRWSDSEKKCVESELDGLKIGVGQSQDKRDPQRTWIANPLEPWKAGAGVHLHSGGPRGVDSVEKECAKRGLDAYSSRIEERNRNFDDPGRNRGSDWSVPCRVSANPPYPPTGSRKPEVSGSGRVEDRCEMKMESAGQERVVVLTPKEYDGTTPWRDYLSHFEKVARANHWRDATKAEQLSHHLVGVADAVLGDIEETGEMSYQEMLDRLEATFGPKSDDAVALGVELRQRKLQPGETLHSLAAYIRKSVNTAYGDKGRALREELMVEIFRNAMTDVRIVEKLISASPSTLQEAVGIAQLNETLRLTAQQVIGTRGQSDPGHRKARSVDMVDAADPEPPVPATPTVLRPPNTPENIPKEESTDQKPKKKRGKKSSPKQEDPVCRTVDSQEQNGEVLKLRAEVERLRKQSTEEEISKLKAQMEEMKRGMKPESVPQDAHAKEIEQLKEELISVRQGAVADELAQLRKEVQQLKAKVSADGHPKWRNGRTLGEETIQTGQYMRHPTRPRVCYRCGDPGHFIRECPYPVCPHCGQSGHSRGPCPGPSASAPLN